MKLSTEALMKLSHDELVRYALEPKMSGRTRRRVMTEFTRRMEILFLYSQELKEELRSVYAKEREKISVDGGSGDDGGVGSGLVAGEGSEQADGFAAPCVVVD